MKRRTLVIGDIHGGLRALKQVLELSCYDSKLDNIIFLGDYVDGWSESFGVIEYLIEMQQAIINLKRDRSSLVFLEGNHDNWFKEFLNTGIPDMKWLENGGKSTMASYEAFFSGMSPEERTGHLVSHRLFFDHLHEHYVDDQNRGFVHAGLDLLGERGLHDTHIHIKLWDRHMWRSVLSGATIKAHKELYIGHTPTLTSICKFHLPEAKLQDINTPITVPMNRQNVWNLDTGGGWSGKLTIMDIDTKEFWQSDFVKNLYPEEKGR